MKDVTKEFFKQSNDYGRKASVNHLDRVKIYVNQTRKIYNLLREKELPLKVFFGKTEFKCFLADVEKATETVREYGKLYYLDPRFPNTRDAFHIRLKGLVPEELRRRKEEAEKNKQKEEA